MTNLRKNLPYALLVLAVMPLAALAALAESPAIDTHTTAVAVDCERRYISQRDASRVLGTANFSQTYAKRQSLYANVARLCHRGVDRVVLIAGEPQTKTRTVASR